MNNFFRKFFKRIIIVVVCMAVMISFPMHSYALTFGDITSDAIKDKEDKISQAENEKKALEDSLKELENKKAQLEKEKKNLSKINSYHKGDKIWEKIIRQMRISKKGVISIILVPCDIK